MISPSRLLLCALFALLSLGVFVPRAEAQLYDDNTTNYAYNFWYWRPPTPTPATNLWHGNNWAQVYFTGTFQPAPIIPDAGTNPQIVGIYAVFWDEVNGSATSNAFHTVEVDSNIRIKGLHFRGGPWHIQDSDQANSITLYSGRPTYTTGTVDRQAITMDTGSEATISAKIVLGAFQGSTRGGPADPGTSQTILMNAGSKLTLSGDISQAATRNDGAALPIPAKTLIIQGTAGTSPATGSILTLSGNNTFTGGLTFNTTVANYGINTTPRLNINSAQALGAGPLTFSGGAAILGNSSGAAVSVANSFVFNNPAGSTGGYTFNVQPVETQSMVFSGAHNLTLTADHALTANRAFGVENNGGALILAGGISGSGGLIKNLSGTLALTKTDNTYTGVTVVNGGVLEVAHLADGGVASSIGASNSTTPRGSIGIVVNSVSTSGSVEGPAVDANTPIPNLVLGGGGTLRYVGTGDSTDRLIAMNPGQFNYPNAIIPVSIDASGSGALQFTNTGPILQLNLAGMARHLVLTGTNTDDNTLSLALTDNRSAARGNNQLTKNGSGTWIVTGNNTHTGGTTVNAGLLVLTGTNTTDAPTTNTANFGTNSAGPGSTTINGGMLQLGNSGTVLSDIGAVIVNGGTFRLGAAAETVASLSGTGGTVDLFNGSGRTLTLAGNASGTFAGAIVGAGGSLVKGGTGSLTLSGNNSYTGATTVSAGTLQFGKTSAFYGSTIDTTNAAKVTIASGATAALNIGGTGEFIAADIDTLRASGNFASGSKLGLDTTNAIGGTFNYASNINGAIGLTKLGAGTLVLAGTNNYTGPTTIDGGTLHFRQTSAFYNGAIDGTTAAQLAVSSGAMARLNVGGPGEFTSPHIDTLLGGGDFASGSSLGLDTTSASGGTFTAAGNIGGAIGLTKFGPGALILSGTNNYTGPTTINGGMLEFADPSAFYNSAGNAVSAGNAGKLTVTLGATAAFNVDAGKFTATDLDTLRNSGNFNSGSSLGIDVSSGTFTYSSIVNGSHGISKLGAGTLTLSGTNTYSGSTTIKAGTLKTTNVSGMGNGTISVQGGVFTVDTSVAIANEVVLAGGAYQRVIAGNLAHAADATSNLGGIDTKAEILSGSLSTSGTLTTSFHTGSIASNDGMRLSDVYSFDGTGSDIFVLQLSFTGTAPDAYLGWLSGSEWVNARDGNSLNNPLYAAQFGGTFAEFQDMNNPLDLLPLSDYLGAWGVDVDGGVTSTWAVINHNSDFTIVPEPSTVALLMLGLGAALLGQRRRKITS